ncbi:MAG: hypothetical protein RLZZ165_136 [Bacteroidota bacterium]
MELIRRMTVQDSQNGPIPTPKIAVTALKGMERRRAATLPGTLVARQAPSKISTCFPGTSRASRLHTVPFRI